MIVAKDELVHAFHGLKEQGEQRLASELIAQFEHLKLLALSVLILRPENLESGSYIRSDLWRDMSLDELEKICTYMVSIGKFDEIETELKRRFKNINKPYIAILDDTIKKVEDFDNKEKVSSLYTPPNPEPFLATCRHWRKKLIKEYKEAKTKTDDSNAWLDDYHPEKEDLGRVAVFFIKRNTVAVKQQLELNERSYLDMLRERGAIPVRDLFRDLSKKKRKFSKSTAHVQGIYTPPVEIIELPRS